MTRRSNWLPARTRPQGFSEPGRVFDSWGVPAGTLGPGTTPLASIGIGLFWATAGVALGLIGLSVFETAPGPVVALALSALFLVLAAFQLRLGIARWLWRRSNVHLTNGVYLRPWQKTPAGYDR